MQNARRPLRRACLLFGVFFSFVLPVLAAERPRVKAEEYVIDGEITPKTDRLTARARVKFTALDDTNFGTFELNNALRPTRILDASGRTLSGERISTENAVRISFPNGLVKGSSNVITFEYEGTLANADDSPVEGLKLAYIGEDITYLLYPGRWFPITNYGIDRFTATINVTAPPGNLVVGSGAARTKGNTTTCSCQNPSMPGSTIAASCAATS